APFAWAYRRRSMPFPRSCSLFPYCSSHSRTTSANVNARSQTMIRTPLALSVVFALGLSGAAQAAGKLNLANWSDYYPPELLKKFEADTGIKATLDAYDSNETLLAKLKAGGGNYDVVAPSDSFIQIMVQEGLL